MNKFRDKIIHIQTDETDEFYTDERCYILELYNTIEDPDQSIARARVEPGVTTAWHRLIDTVETLIVQSGQGTLELNEDEVIEIKQGSIIRIPENCPQRVINTGNEDLIFLCFCSPAFGDHCYEDLE